MFSFSRHQRARIFLWISLTKRQSIWNKEYWEYLEHCNRDQVKFWFMSNQEFWGFVCKFPYCLTLIFTKYSMHCFGKQYPAIISKIFLLDLLFLKLAAVMQNNCIALLLPSFFFCNMFKEKTIHLLQHNEIHISSRHVFYLGLPHCYKTEIWLWWWHTVYICIYIYV